MPDRTVDTALDAGLDAALGRAPEVRIPPHFANRMMASLPPTPADAPVRPWVLPAVSLAGGATLASLGWTAAALGWTQWFGHPSVLATVLGLEAVVSLAWVWRMLRSAR